MGLFFYSIINSIERKREDPKPASIGLPQVGYLFRTTLPHAYDKIIFEFMQVFSYDKIQ